MTDTAWKPTPGRDAMTRDGRKAKTNGAGPDGRLFGSVSGVPQAWSPNGVHLFGRRNLDLVADGWVKHTPGPCPVAPETVVDVRYSSGPSDFNPSPASMWYVGHWSDGTITHYRIVRPAPSGPVVEESKTLERNFVADGFDAGLRTFRILRDLGVTRGRPFSDEYIIMAVLQDAEKAATETLRQIGEAMEGK